MKKTKAFTIVEFMVVIAIIGIIAAITVPAFKRVRASSLQKAEATGRELSTEERELIKEWGNVPIEVVEKSITKPIAVTKPALSFQTIVTDGKTVYLIPKKYYEEVRIGSDSFLLVPQ